MANEKISKSRPELGGDGFREQNSCSLGVKVHQAFSKLHRSLLLIYVILRSINIRPDGRRYPDYRGRILLIPEVPRDSPARFSGERYIL